MTAPPEPVIRFVVERHEEGCRLDRAVVRRLQDLKGCSRARVQRWIDAGRVTIDDGPAGKGAKRLAVGAHVAVRLPRPRPPRAPAQAEQLPLDVLYEDEWLVAVGKPAGVVMHPTAGYASGTLFNALLWHARAWKPDQEPGLLHRLDRDTSGVVLVAKDRGTLTLLARAMNGRRIGKDYLAVVQGTMRTPKDRIELGLARDPDEPTRMRAEAGRGLASVTLVEEVAVAAQPPVNLSLVKCTLVTGRMHQIRAHLEARHLPIIGDPVYGRAVTTCGDPDVDALTGALGRQALHAHRLRLAHPVTGVPLAIVAPLPRELRTLVDAVAWDVRSHARADLGWPIV